MSDALSRLILNQDTSVDTYNVALGEVFKMLIFHFRRDGSVTHDLVLLGTHLIKAAKREKRQAERKFRKSRLQVHK